MSNRLLSVVLRRAEALAVERSADGQSDADMLRRFVDSRDEAAFSIVVHRHGPMIWSVCRQMLSNPADADDAFQAVFLVLIQSGSKLVRVKSLGGWLHAVTVRVCLKARRTAVRRKQREQANAKPEGVTPPPQWDDLHAAVHEEVGRLPESLRTAFVLCDLQGVRQPDAATQLGWKLGTLSGRLTRARQMLLKNLTARGLAPVLAVGTVSIGGIATGGVPSALTNGVFALLRNGANGGSGVSTIVLELAHGATEGLMTKIKLTVGSLMLTVGMVTVAGLPMAGAQRPAEGVRQQPMGAEKARPRPTLPVTEEPATARAADPKPATIPTGADVDPTAAPTPKPSAPRTGSSPTASAQRFEHLLVATPDTPQELTSLFQEKEKAGWEYVGVVSVRVPSANQNQLVFKRPKGNGATANIYGGSDGGPATGVAPTITTQPGSYPTPARYPSRDSTPADPTSPARTPSNTIPPRRDAAPKATTPEPSNEPKQADKLPSGFEVMALKHARATEVAKTLRELFTVETPSAVVGRTPPFTVSADERTNSVIFRPGRGVTSEDVKAMIEKLDTSAKKDEPVSY